jgi:ubiquinone/menaquinone biosynthesis C-methylase UbiE
MLDMASVKSRSHVLDVAAGARDQDLSRRETRCSRRLCPPHRHFSQILELALENARNKSFQNVQTRTLDGEILDVETGAFDAVISSVGLIYFPDRTRLSSACAKP